MGTHAKTRGSMDVLRVQQTRQQTRQFYDHIAPFYDLLSGRAESPIRQHALEMIGAEPAERMLEIGPGTGQNLVALAAAVGPTGRVFGIDLSERMLEHAQRRLQQAGLAERAKLVCGDAAQLPFAAGFFDGVLMTFTLELFSTPEIPAVLAECRRVLRSDGRIAVAALTKETRSGAVVHALEWMHVHFPRILDCRPIYVRRALAAAGFTIVAANTMRVWVPIEIVLGKLPATSPRPKDP